MYVATMCVRGSINHRLKFATKTNCVGYGSLAKQPAFPASPSIITIKVREQQSYLTNNTEMSSRYQIKRRMCKKFISWNLLVDPT